MCVYYIEKDMFLVRQKLRKMREWYSCTDDFLNLTTMAIMNSPSLSNYKYIF